MHISDALAAIESCDFQSVDGPLANHAAWVWLKQAVATRTISNRAYTLQELEELRYICQNKIATGSFRNSSRHGVSMTATEIVIAAESLVRTYMVTGMTADAVVERERKAHDLVMSGNTSIT